MVVLGMRYIILLIVVMCGGWLLWQKGDTIPGYASDYGNAAYVIEGTRVQLVDGAAESDGVITQEFGNEVTGDMSGDGIADVAFILAQQPGGTGTFYYIAVARGFESGYVGTNALLLGDRIAPQTTELRDGVIIVNYADRKPGEPMTADPSVGVSRMFRIENNVLKEVSR